MTLRHPYVAITTIATVCVVAALILAGFSPRGGLNATRCLNEHEDARYEVIQDGRPGTVRITVFNLDTQSPVWSRDFAVPSTSHVRNHELRDCHIYIHERYGFDAKTGKTSPGYYWALMQYEYFTTSQDKGRRVITFLENPTGNRGGEVRPSYSSQFTISSDERFISLARSILGEPDYALVIKDVETGEDKYVLTLDEVMRQYPSAAGSFSAGKWVTRPDGEYLVTEIYDGPREPAFVHIKADTWETEILPTPRDMYAGVERAIPPFAPYIAYTDLVTFAGIQQVADAILEERIASGDPKRLLVADMRAGTSKLLEEVPVTPGHRWNLKWLSDTELEYTMPDGVVKTYRVE